VRPNNVRCFIGEVHYYHLLVVIYHKVLITRYNNNNLIGMHIRKDLERFFIFFERRLRLIIVDFKIKNKRCAQNDIFANTF